MELDDFKFLKIPETPEIPVEGSGLVIQDLYKKVDETVRSTVRKNRIQIAINLILAAIYLRLALSGKLQPGLLFIASGFIVGSIYLLYRYRPLPDEYYLLTLKEFIDKTRSWLKYFTLADWLVITPVLIIIGIGGGIHLVSRLARYTDARGLIIAIWVIFYTGLCIFGYFAGRKNWNQRYNSLLRYLQRFSDSL